MSMQVLAQRRPVLSPPLAGVAWMFTATICAVAVTALIRLVGQDVPAAQSSFLRFSFGAAILLPMLWPLLRSGLSRGALKAFVARGVLHTVAVLLTYVAIVRIPLAEVTAIGYLMPVLVSVGAVVWYGEPFAPRRVVAVIVALGGALVILRPGLREIGIGQAAQLGAAVFAAVSYLMVKHLIRLASPSQVVAMLSLTVAICMAPLAWLTWGPITLLQLFWIGLTGLLATLGHYCMTRAFKAAPLGVVQPVVFLQLIWSVAVGVVMFGDPVDPFVLIGGTVIVAAICMLAWRESSLARAVATVAHPAFDRADGTA